MASLFRNTMTFSYGAECICPLIILVSTFLTEFPVLLTLTIHYAWYTQMSWCPNLKRQWHLDFLLSLHPQLSWGWILLFLRMCSMLFIFCDPSFIELHSDYVNYSSAAIHNAQRLFSHINIRLRRKPFQAVTVKPHFHHVIVLAAVLNCRIPACCSVFLFCGNHCINYWWVKSFTVVLQKSVITTIWCSRDEELWKRCGKVREMPEGMLMLTLSAETASWQNMIKGAYGTEVISFILTECYRYVV